MYENSLTWLTNNCNSPSKISHSQYLKEWKQSHNKNWLVNRIYHEEYFSWKNIIKMGRKNCLQILFWKKRFQVESSWVKSRQVECYQNIMKVSCRLIAFTSFKLFWKTKKVWVYCTCLIFCMIFKENVSLVIFRLLTKFQKLASFTLWDVEQYAYCNCSLTRFWRHKFRI